MKNFAIFFSVFLLSTTSFAATFSCLEKSSGKELITLIMDDADSSLTAGHILDDDISNDANAEKYYKFFEADQIFAVSYKNISVIYNLKNNVNVFVQGNQLKNNVTCSLE